MMGEGGEESGEGGHFGAADRKLFWKLCMLGLSKLPEVVNYIYFLAVLNYIYLLPWQFKQPGQAPLKHQSPSLLASRTGVVLPAGQGVGALVLEGGSLPGSHQGLSLPPHSPSGAPKSEAAIAVRVDILTRFEYCKAANLVAMAEAFLSLERT